MNFKDHFSGHAASYASARPDYPPELFAFLAQQCRQKQLALDCATGNGQAAVALANWFERIVASDASQSQLDQAQPHPQVEYRCAAAEEQLLAAESADLITVAQALHWFDQDKFWRACATMLKPGGLLACWSYGIHHIDGALDELCAHYYQDIVGEYWPSERQAVETAYSEVIFPFPLIATPQFAMDKQWRMEQLLAYLESWSATQRYMQERGENPLLRIIADMEKLWGDAEARQVSWPLTVKLCRKP